VARGQAARCHAATGLAVSAAELSRTYFDPPNQPAVHEAAEAAGTKKRVTPHTLRHSFATHLLGQDVDIRVIQVLLGHSKLDTALYSRVATKTIRAVTSPLEHLRLLMEGEDPGG
jgi:integrase/recombinase XerD